MSVAPSDVSELLTKWGNALKATHKIVDATRHIEATKDSLEAINRLCSDIGTESEDSPKLREALAQLAVCTQAIGELSSTGRPLQEQHRRVEACLREAIDSGRVSSEEVTQVKAQLETSVIICQSYQQQMAGFLTEMDTLRGLFFSAIDEVQQEATNLASQASSTKWKGFGGSAVLGTVAGALGIACTVANPPGAAVVAAAVAGSGAGMAALVTSRKTVLRSQELKADAQKFHEAAEALKACDTAFAALTDKVSLGPVSLTEELVQSLKYVLQVYSSYHEKEEEARKLQHENIQLAAECELSKAKELEKDKLIERLQRLLVEQQGQTLAGGSQPN